MPSSGCYREELLIIDVEVTQLSRDLVEGTLWIRKRIDHNLVAHVGIVTSAPELADQ